MCRLKAIIFDVDGALVATEETHRQAFNQVFKETLSNASASIKGIINSAFFSGELGE